MEKTNSWVYQIRLTVDKKCRIPIGKLGEFTFYLKDNTFIPGEPARIYSRESVGIKDRIKNVFVGISTTSCPISMSEYWILTSSPGNPMMNILKKTFEGPYVYWR